jgi:transcriptional regulator with XRE-family HTH domain
MLTRMPRPPKPHPVPHPLQQWREQVGMTQGALAKACGLTQGMISHIENRRRIALGDALEALLRVTGLPTDAFIRPDQFLREHPDYFQRRRTRRRRRPPPQGEPPH